MVVAVTPADAQKEIHLADATNPDEKKYLIMTERSPNVRSFFSLHLLRTRGERVQNSPQQPCRSEFFHNYAIFTRGFIIFAL